MLGDFGPYTIVRKMAVGGMAEIYLARERGLEGLERTVVLKRILPTYSDHPEFVTMFLDEARLLAALSHPNIAQVFGLGKLEGSFYLVMEYVRGPTLGTLLGAAARAKLHGLPRREALGIALQIAHALDYVHGRRDDIGRPLGIVHRDLNPANVMVSWDGSVKIIDFGIAKAATKVYETRTGVIKGTYGYMAPEQLSKKAGVDHRADVFALGVILYEMCVGTHPFDASNEANIIDRLLKAAYKRPREVDPSFPPDLDSLIARCLSVHPGGRPPEVRAVIDEIVRHLESQHLVPTMTDLAELARRLVPDVEGPLPLKRLSTSERMRAFGSEPSQTSRLPTRQPVSEPPDFGQVLSKEESTIPVGSFRSGRRDDTEETAVADRATEALGREAPFGHDGMEPTALAAPLVPMPPEPREEPAPRHRPRRRQSFARRAVLFAASATLVLGVGVAAFVTARAISGRAAAPPPTVAEEAVPAAAEVPLPEPPPPLALLVTSEPEGARIFFDSADTGATTPTTLPVDGLTRVLVRAVLDGYVTQEREVLATAGEARFVLLPLVLDAGAPDAGMEEGSRPRRPAKRLRRRRR